MTYRQIHNAICRWLTAGGWKTLALALLCLWLLGLVAARAEIRNRDYAALQSRAETAERMLQELTARVEPEMDVDEVDLLSRMIYGYYRAGATRPDQWELIAWAAVNRVEANDYPDTLEAVITQKSQWQGFSEDNPVLTDIQAVAADVLDTWHSGGARSVAPEFVFLKLSGGKVELRTEYIDSASCRYMER